MGSRHRRDFINISSPLDINEQYMQTREQSREMCYPRHTQKSPFHHITTDQTMRSDHRPMQQTTSITMSAIGRGFVMHFLSSPWQSPTTTLKLCIVASSSTYTHIHTHNQSEWRWRCAFRWRSFDSLTKSCPKACV